MLVKSHTFYEKLLHVEALLCEIMYLQNKRSQMYRLMRQGFQHLNTLIQLGRSLVPIETKTIKYQCEKLSLLI